MMWTTQPRSEFGDLAAIVAGQGPVVVLIHGVGLRAEAWAAQINALSQHYTVIALDMPGHGHSVGFTEPPDLSDYADRIVDALDRPVHIIGHSMGAMLALDIAIHFPGLTRSVTAMNAIFERTPQAAQAVKDRADALAGHNSPDPTPTLRRWFVDLNTDAARACAGWLGAVDGVGYKQAYTVFATENGPDRDDLAQLRAPALFMTGQDEPNSTPAMSRAMAEIAPKGDAILIDGAAHMMPMTHADVVNTALFDFLAGV